MKVLFICKYNVGRSQMAEAIFNKFAKHSKAISAGAKPEYYMMHHYGVMPKNDPVITVMREIGIDMKKKRMKKVSRKMVDEADIVIGLMAQDKTKKDLPDYVTKSPKFRLWPIVDVSGSTEKSAQVAKHRRNRDIIKRKIVRLLTKGDR